jgi:hypothetical protein
MWSYLAPSLIFGVAACGAAKPPILDQIEINAPGLQITVGKDGKGRFNQTMRGKRGRFTLSHEKFSKLVQRMEPFRLSGETMTEPELQTYFETYYCRGDYVTDNGGISFHWQGPAIDRFYTVDYGCDREKHAARNKELRAILASLPVPAPEPLP